MAGHGPPVDSSAGPVDAKGFTGWPSWFRMDIHFGPMVDLLLIFGEFFKVSRGPPTGLLLKGVQWAPLVGHWRPVELSVGPVGTRGFAWWPSWCRMDIHFGPAVDLLIIFGDFFKGNRVYRTG